MDFLIEILIVFVLLAMLWLLVKVIRCFNCDNFQVRIKLSTNDGVFIVDNTIPFPGSAVATAVITNNGTPVDGAVFDADPTWAVNDPTIISFSQTGVMTGLVTALAAGVTTLDVDGAYLGNAVHGAAIVTVTGTANNFAVDIQWANTPSIAKK